MNIEYIHTVYLFWASPDLDPGPDLLKSFLQGSELYGKWQLGFSTRRPCLSLSHDVAREGGHLAFLLSFSSQMMKSEC